MRVLLVTSQVTFVPENYDALVAGLAVCPQVCGLLVLRNRSARLASKAAGLTMAGAPRLGAQLLANMLGRSGRRRRDAYAAAGKPVWELDTVNSDAALALVRDERIDLVLNARTRFIYREPILSAPPLGCLNVHHGLLPGQRGTMCDLWALYEGVPAGFTIHRMDARIDAGRILRRVEVSDGSERNYPAYLLRSSRLERQAVADLLAEAGRAGLPEGAPNEAGRQIAHRHNPGWRQIMQMRRRGLVL